jgi:hypothetical protein
VRLPVPGWRRMGSAREETVQGPSSSSRKDWPKRSDPSEVGWGRRGWEAEAAGGGAGRAQWKRGSG